MSRNLTAGMAAAVVAPVTRPILLAKISTSGAPVLAWSGIGEVIFNGDTYLGVGNLGGVSQVEETEDVKAVGMTFQLSGIPSALIALALGDIRQGLKAYLYFGLLNVTTGALITDPYLLFSGLTDTVFIDENTETSTISITCENRMIDLLRARERRYTPEDQKTIDPTDLGFDFVAGLQDAVAPFGN
jgi:hypothetical protein